MRGKFIDDCIFNEMRNIDAWLIFNDCLNLHGYNCLTHFSSVQQSLLIDTRP